MLDCLSKRWGWRAVDEVAKQKGNKIWHFDKRNRNGKSEKYKFKRRYCLRDQIRISISSLSTYQQARAGRQWMVVKPTVYWASNADDDDDNCWLESFPYRKT